MPDFSEPIEYDVPELEILKDKFKAAASIRKQGTEIVVGGCHAHKKGLLTEFFNKKMIYDVFTPQSIKPISFSFSSKMEKDDCITILIDTMADLEAKRTLPRQIKNAALKTALLAAVAKLEI